MKWNVKEQMVGMVFDTTASNTGGGEHSGGLGGLPYPLASL